MVTCRLGWPAGIPNKRVYKSGEDFPTPFLPIEYAGINLLCSAQAIYIMAAIRGPSERKGLETGGTCAGGMESCLIFCCSWLSLRHFDQDLSWRFVIHVATDHARFGALDS